MRKILTTFALLSLLAGGCTPESENNGNGSEQTVPGGDDNKDNTEEEQKPGEPEGEQEPETPGHDLTPSDGEGDPVEISFLAAFPASRLADEDSVSIFQIDTAGACLRRNAKVIRDIQTGFSATFPVKEGAEYNYIVISPVTSSDVPQLVFDLGPGDPLYGIVKNGSAAEANPVNMKRFGAVVRINIPYLSEKVKVSGMEARFNVPVGGKATFDSNLEPIAAPDTSKTAVFDGEGRQAWIRILPTTLYRNQKIFISATTDKGVLQCNYGLASQFNGQNGAELTIDAKVASTRKFTNPVINKVWADPTIWYENGWFYTACTGASKAIHRSRDMIKWESTGIRYVSAADATYCTNTFDATGFWAPDVVKVGNKWNLYFTLHVDSVDSTIGLFQSDTPDGTFKYKTYLTRGRDTKITSIDPEVVQDPATGKWWMFYGSSKGIHRVELNSDATALNGPIEHVSGVDIATNSDRDKVTEGGYVYYHDGYWYLFASTGKYANASYRTVVCRSATIDGVYTNKAGKKMTEGNFQVVLSSVNGDEMYGPGHNGEIFTDLAGQDYIFYHCHDSKTAKAKGEDAGSRYLFLQRIFWDENGWPYCETGKPVREDVAPLL